MYSPARLPPFEGNGCPLTAVLHGTPDCPVLKNAGDEDEYEDRETFGQLVELPGARQKRSTDSALGPHDPFDHRDHRPAHSSDLAHDLECSVECSENHHLPDHAPVPISQGSGMVELLPGDVHHLVRHRGHEV